MFELCGVFCDYFDVIEVVSLFLNIVICDVICGIEKVGIIFLKLGVVKCEEFVDMIFNVDFLVECVLDLFLDFVIVVVGCSFEMVRFVFFYKLNF